MNFCACMKKLLILLILSFFSTTGYSGVSYPAADSSDQPALESPPSTRTCPDGNEPTKGISDDGYYFVYTCGSVPPVPIVSPKAEVMSEDLLNGALRLLLDSGIISEEQFEKMKQKIIDNI